MIFFPATLSVIQEASPSSDYISEVQKWRVEVADSLKKEDGWLAVAGLHWLSEGSTPFGVDTLGHFSVSDIAKAKGNIVRSGDKLTLHLNSKTGTTLNGLPTVGGDLRLNADKFAFGPITVMAIQRGTRIGLRVWDTEAVTRRNFKGLNWYSVGEGFRINAKYVAYKEAKEMSITNVLGDVQPVKNPGYVEFTLDGHKCHLEAQDAGDGLFFNFKDSTSGKTTYGAGRFLDAPKPKDGIVVLDFNRATNPPCAFTDFATCPLPPRANFLTVAIPAGEKTYGHH